jgi:hypothetical protein
MTTKSYADCYDDVIALSGGCDLSHGDRRTRRERDGLALLVWHGIGDVTAGTGCGR